MPAKEQLEIAVGCRGSPGEHGREAGSCGGSGSQLPPAGGLPDGLANLFPRGRGGEEGDGEAVTGRACYVKAPSYRCRQLARIPPNPAAPSVRPLPPSPPRGLPRAERKGGGPEEAGEGPEEAGEPRGRPLPASNPGPEDASWPPPSPLWEGAAGCSPERLEGSAAGSGRGEDVAPRGNLVSARNNNNKSAWFSVCMDFGVVLVLTRGEGLRERREGGSLGISSSCNPHCIRSSSQISGTYFKNNLVVPTKGWKCWCLRWQSFSCLSLLLFKVCVSECFLCHLL